MKIRKKFFVWIQFVLDILAIISSVYLAYFVRISLNPIFINKFRFDFVHSLLPPFYLIVFVFLVFLYYHNLYDFSRKEKYFDVFSRLFRVSTLSILCLMIMVFLFWTKDFSRSLFLIFWITSFLLLNISHFMGMIILKKMKSSGLGIERVAIVGPDNKTVRIAKKIKEMKYSIYQFVGFIGISTDPSEKSGDEGLNSSGLTSLGKVGNIGEIINDYMIDRIIISESVQDISTLCDVISICEKMEIQVDRIPSFLNVTSGKVSLTEIDGCFLITIQKDKRLKGTQLIKRGLDIFVSGVALLLLFPLFFLIAMLIKIDSKGPVFFSQKRIGKGGKNFYFVKFRSMVADADQKKAELLEFNEADGYLFKIKKDPRVTRVGKFLRKLSLDELPTLWNVLHGEMSLVGPRPLPYSDLRSVQECEEYKFWFNKRNEVPPGITGLWQMSGRSDLNFNDMVKLDIYYLEQWNLWMDIKVLLKTIPIVLLGKGAY